MAKLRATITVQDAEPSRRGPVCETKSLQQLPRTYIFNKKVNIAHQLEDMLHACRPEPATRARKFPWLIRLARNLGQSWLVIFGVAIIRQFCLWPHALAARSVDFQEV